MKLRMLSLAVFVASVVAACSSSEDGNKGGGSGGAPGGSGGKASGGTGNASGGSAGLAAGGAGAAAGSGGNPSGGTNSGGGSGSGGCATGDGGGVCGNDGTSWPVTSQAKECKFIEALNQKRAAGVTCGSTDMPPVAALARNQVLTDNARLHSQDMAQNQYVDLTRKDGTGPMDWSMKGYCGTYVTAEVEGGQPDPSTVLAELLYVESECKKLMAAGGKGIGVGYYTDASGTSVHLWTLVIGSAP